MKKSSLIKLLISFGCLVLFISCNSVPKGAIYPYATETPVVLPAGTDGSVGPEGTYVLFGDWPQSVKADDVTVSEEKEVLNGWECYKGSDGFYYVKAMAEPYENSYPYKGNFTFDNGETIEKGKYYYFKIEPIKWRVITDDYEGGKLLLAEKVLQNISFFPKWGFYERTVNGKTVYSNNYKYSTVRAYLNGLNGNKYEVEDFSGKGFINKAFTRNAINSINTVTVDNSAESAIDSSYDLKEAVYYEDYACGDTKDKIFLLSKNEITRKNYGFSGENIWGKESCRLRKTTDYSRAIGAYPDMSYENFKNNGTWWLRSPYYKYSNCPQAVSIHGKSDGGSDGGIAGWGIVPALSINF